MNQEIADTIERIGIKRVAEAAGVKVSTLSSAVRGVRVLPHSDAIQVAQSLETSWQCLCLPLDLTDGPRVLRITGRNSHHARVTLRPGVRYEGQFLAYRKDHKTGKLVVVKGSRAKIVAPTIEGMVNESRKVLANVVGGAA